MCSIRLSTVNISLVLVTTLVTYLECCSSQHFGSDAKSQRSLVGGVFHDQTERKSHLLGRHDAAVAVLKALHGNSKLYGLLRINLHMK